MKDPKVISVTLDNRTVAMELALKDDDLLEAIFHALKGYVREGTPIKVVQSYDSDLSVSKGIITKLLIKGDQVDEWEGEMKQLISVLQKTM